MRKILSTFTIILTLGFFNYIFAQDNCGAAVAIPLEVYGSCGDMFFTNVNFAEATTSTDAPAPTCGGFATTTEDMWYSFEVPAGVTELAFHAFNSPPPIPMMGPPACAPGMAVYRGTCGNLTLIDCFNADAGFMGMENGEIRWEVLGVTPGETIYVRLWEKTNNETSIFFAASVITSLPEADCNNPPELSTSGCNILAPGGTIQAPDDCGWNTTDNVVFYSFEVLPTDPQPVVIEIEYGQCWANEYGGMLPPDNPEIQFAVYSWNGTNCTGIGGSPASDPPNNTTYYGCENGVGTVVYSNTLPPGQYVLAMDGFSSTTGNSLCTFGIAASFIDDDPPVTGELSVTLSTVNVGCGQLGSATITVNSSCSTSPTINWSNAASGTNTISGLAAGTYSVTVSDQAPCADTIINFTIADQSNFVVAITTSGNPCAGPVTLFANVMGANPADVSFVWNPGGQTTQSITVNNGGTYAVTATYGTCIDDASIVVPDGDFDFSVNYTPTFCEGGSGAAQFNLISGTGPFMYEWSTGAISAGIQITEPGNYCLTATDLSNGCQLIRCFSVEELPAVDVEIEKTDITCHNFNDGKVTAIASGGTPPYSYEWNGYIQGETMSNLIQGNYSVIVTDSAGCTGSATIFIDNPPQLTYSISPNQGICFGEQAEISVIANGGVEPYTYAWSDDPANNVDTRIVSPEITSQYTVTVYDANHCTFPAQTTTVIVSQPISILPNVENVLCHGVCEGSTVLDITGGIPPFAITWTNVDDNTISTNVTDSWDNLCAGNYEVSLTDLYGCEGSASFTITEPDTMYLTILSGNATCYGYTDGFVQVEATGGVPYTNEFGPFYQYEWSNGLGADSLAVGYGTYYVTVSDANGCSHVGVAFVDQPEDIYVTPPWGGQICIGESFSTYVAATGGLGPYEFIWYGSDNTIWYGDGLNVSPEVTTIYQLTTIDSRGCFGPVQTIQVKVHLPIKINEISSSKDDICLGENLTVDIDYEGGNGGPYTITTPTYGIVNTPFNFNPDSTGYYVFTVADDCGSPVAKDSIYVVVHEAPKVAFFADKTSSCPPGTIYFTNVDEEINNTYLWNFGDGGFSVEKDPNHTYDKTGTYTVSLTAWTEYGCKKTKTYNNLIFIHPKPRAEFTASPALVSILNPEITVENFSEGGTAYFWNFGDGETPDAWSDDKNPRKYTYNYVGEYDITLIIKNQYECIDSIHKKVRVHDEYAFYAPDAFTPNGDGINDYFHLIGHGIDKKQFYMVIYDRFGIKVFETNVWDEENPYRMAWDGTHNGSVENGDKVLPNGMYRWYASFVDFTGKPHEKSGTVTIVR